MKWYRNLKISAKLIIGFIIVAILAGIVGAVGIINLNQIGEADSRLYSVNTMGTNYASTACIYYQRIRFNSMKSLVIDDQGKRDELLQKSTNYTALAEENLTAYENADLSEDNRALFNTIKPEWQAYKDILAKVVENFKGDRIDEAKNLILGDLAAAGDALQLTFDNLMKYNADSGKEKNEQNMKLVTTSTVTMIVVVAVGVILALVLGIVISRMISRPVNIFADFAKMLALGDVNVGNLVTEKERQQLVSQKNEIGTLASSFDKVIESTQAMTSVAQQLAQGDLSVDVKVRSENDILGMSLSELVSRLGDIMETIVLAAGQVAAGSNQVSDSSMALSQGATEQASSVQELTASLQEIAAQVIQNAESARTASDLAKSAESNAADGNGQMKDLLDAMEAINQSSSSISKIIKVIDDIAFQTNILALNAAVEAARAGQHGKGFAVVAEEVRNLAAKSASAAKETTELIENSIKKVDVGTKIANSTALALNQIVVQVKKASDIVSDISSASSEQSAGIEQINQGVIQISQVVQSNAASAEESAAASEELSSQAAKLKEIVGFFRLKRGSGMTASPVAEVSPRKAVTMLTAKKIAIGEGEMGKY